MNTSSLTNLERAESIELPTATFTKLEHNIVWVQYKFVEADFDLVEAHTHTEALRKLGNGAPMHILIDLRKGDADFTNEARAYFANDKGHASLRKSQAFVLKSLAHNIVANFYFKFNKPTCPVAIFYDTDEAMKWILSIPPIQ